MLDIPLTRDTRRPVFKLEDQPPRERPRPDSPAGATIVCCHADPPLLELFGEIFADEPYNVRTCRHPDQFQELLRAAKPGLAILDLQLGGVGAQQVMAGMRAEAATASIPVLMCTTDPPEMHAPPGWVREAGCEMLPLPFDLDHLLDQVNRLIG